MAFLVADIGGTNTRLALIDPDMQTTESARFENDRFGSFYELLDQYVTGRSLPALEGSCFAIAGPVTSDQARLTNRDWHFDVAQISKALHVAGVLPVRLVNDLVALGYALPKLTPDQRLQIKPSHQTKAPNTQALVAGLGTGFNVCAVRNGPGEPVVFEAELGHGSLPSSVHLALVEAIGAEADQFRTNEDLFSGGGLSRLHYIISGGQDRRGQDILAAYGSSAVDHTKQSVELIAQLLGTFAREMVFQYLPFGGIHFAGGAACGILGSGARADFLKAFKAPGHFADYVNQVPVQLITDDGAALIGAARLAMGGMG